MFSGCLLPHFNANAGAETREALSASVGSMPRICRTSVRSPRRTSGISASLQQATCISNDQV